MEKQSSVLFSTEKETFWRRSVNEECRYSASHGEGLTVTSRS
jgi:hypothetical protein